MKWFGHIQRRPATALVRKSLAMKADGPPRVRGRPKRTWMEVVKINMRKCNLSKDLAQDRSEWRNKIHVDRSQYSWDKASMMTTTTSSFIVWDNGVVI